MKNFEDKFEQFDCALSANCKNMGCDKDCKVIAEYWYRQALEFVSARRLLSDEGWYIPPHIIDEELKDERPAE